MLPLLKEVHFWSTQEDILIKATDYGSYKYYNRKDNGDIYAVSKQDYAERRGSLWTPVNKRKNRLKDKLKEFEEYLAQYKIICFHWKSEEILRLLLENGVLVTITVNLSDIAAISFDKQLIQKLQNDLICDAVITHDQIIATLTSSRLVGIGGIWPQLWSTDVTSTRRQLSRSSDWLAVWGSLSPDNPITGDSNPSNNNVTTSAATTTTTATSSDGGELPQPWSPPTAARDRANVHVYWVGGARGAELCVGVRTEGEPIEVMVSGRRERTVLVVEQKVTQRGSVSIELTQSELHSSTLRRISVIAIPLQTQVSCTAFSPDENHLLLGCIDGSLALLNRRRGSTRIIRTAPGSIPALVTWHSSSALCAVGDERGQLRYYDVALQGVAYQLQDDTATTTFPLSLYLLPLTPTKVSLLHWQHPHLLLVSLPHGPLLTLHLSPAVTFPRLCDGYLRGGEVERAIALLRSWEFGGEAYGVLQRVVGWLMRKSGDGGMTEGRVRCLQEVLGVWYQPEGELSGAVRHKYGQQVKALTRRFFHQLVRCGFYEMAFLLAVDLGHHDLFMDLHFVAVKLNHTEMAAAARAQAEALLSRCSSASSNCSRSSCSQCLESSSSADSSCEDDIHTLALLKDKATNNLSDNYLSTNFNSAIPKTYKTTPTANTTVVNIPTIDLPKIQFNKPAISANKNSARSNSISTVLPPPLPQVPTASTTLSDLNQDIGIPIMDYTSQQQYNSNLRQYPAISGKSQHNMMNSPLYLNNFNNTPTAANVYYPSPHHVASSVGSNSGNLTRFNGLMDDRNSFTPIRTPVVPPPLPIPLAPSSFSNFAGKLQPIIEGVTNTTYPKSANNKLGLGSVDSLSSLGIPNIRQFSTNNTKYTSNNSDSSSGSKISDSYDLNVRSGQSNNPSKLLSTSNYDLNVRSSNNPSSKLLSTVIGDSLNVRSGQCNSATSKLPSNSDSYHLNVRQSSNLVSTSNSDGLNVRLTGSADSYVSPIRQLTTTPSASAVGSSNDSNVRLGSSKSSDSNSSSSYDLTTVRSSESFDVNIGLVNKPSAGSDSYLSPIRQHHLSTTVTSSAVGTSGSSNNIRKPQANKVKFSDTVTAFIVPEVKRPIRPPPPAHVTDPQKELADSLPLCHPNEDYLKDFAPIRKEDEVAVAVGNSQMQLLQQAPPPVAVMSTTTVVASQQQPPPPHSKIKVVHFGVV